MKNKKMEILKKIFIILLAYLICIGCVMLIILRNEQLEKNDTNNQNYNIIEK